MKSLIKLALYNLLEVDTEISRLSEVVVLDEESYYLQLYRIATGFLDLKSNELEIKSVRLIQAVVLYETVDVNDVEYEELRELLFQDVQRKFEQLTGV